MQWFLWDEFDIWMSEYTISRWLKKEDIRKKRIRFLAAERNQFLRDDWIRRLAQWKHYQMIFIDESAANERTKDRKHGWAPIGVRPTEHRPHKRSERWSILPAYTSRGGYIAYEIVQGSITKDLFLEFLRNKVMPHCHRYDCYTPLGVYPASLTPSTVSVCQDRKIWRPFIGDHSGPPSGAADE